MTHPKNNACRPANGMRFFNFSLKTMEITNENINDTENNTKKVLTGKLIAIKTKNKRSPTPNTSKSGAFSLNFEYKNKIKIIAEITLRLIKVLIKNNSKI